MDDLENRIEVWKTYVNKIGEMFLNEEYNICQKFQKDSESFSKFKEKYEKEFIKYKTEERFTIPIIGIISSGKSTFLNVILQNNYLETDTNIATKFICILRHNRFLREPKLYKVKAERRKVLLFAYVVHLQESVLVSVRICFKTRFDVRFCQFVRICCKKI